MRLFRRRESALSFTECQKRSGCFHQRVRLASAQIGARFARSQELVLQLTRPIENVLDRRGRHADDIAEFLRQVEDQAVRRAGRQREGVLGALALRLGLATADLGETGERNCDDGDGKRAANPIALPCGRGPPARTDEVLVQVGGRIGVGRAAVEPALGGFEVRAAQGRALAPSLLVPVSRQLAEPRMLAHPGKVGMQRRVERCQRRVLVIAFGQEHPVEPAQRRRGVGVRDAARHHRDEPLAESRALFQLPGADRRCDRIRAHGENNRVGGGDQPGQALLPGFARRDIRLVKEGVETALGQRPDHHLRKSHVLARIGDEDLGVITGRDRYGRRRHMLVHCPSSHPRLICALIKINGLWSRWLSAMQNYPREVVDGARSQQRGAQRWFVEDGEKVCCFSAPQNDASVQVFGRRE